MIGALRMPPRTHGLAAALLVLVLAAGLVAAKLGRVATWVDRIQAVVQQGGIAHWAVFVLLQIGVAAFGFLPASLIAVAAGVTYGLWHGFAVSATGTLIGGMLAFLLSRSVFRPWIARRILRDPRLARLDAAVAADGWRFVCLLRLSPIMPFAATSYGLGLTRLDLRSFLLGTLASLPALLGYVAMGAVGQAGISLGSGRVGTLHAILLAIGALATILFVIHARTLLRRSLARAGAAEAPDGSASSRLDSDASAP
jgi:uncharacterized membrane protein YdjX (TVP38/TMEM64 family)